MIAVNLLSEPARGAWPSCLLGSATTAAEAGRQADALAALRFLVDDAERIAEAYDHVDMPRARRSYLAWAAERFARWPGDEKGST